MTEPTASAAPAESTAPAFEQHWTAAPSWKDQLSSGRTLVGRHVVVAGAGTTGLSVARYLVGQGASVLVADDRPVSGWAAPVPILAGLTEPPPGTDFIVTSPGWRPESALFVAAAAAGIPVIGDIELAWWADRADAVSPAVNPAAGLDRDELMFPEAEFDDPDTARETDDNVEGALLTVPDRPRRPWLGVTGTNGKTTTIGMVESILRAAGRRAVAAGNVGVGVLDVVTAQPPHDVIALELSSFQLHYAPSVRPDAGVVLNVAEDHLDWHGSMDAYAAAKARVLAGAIAIGVVDDPGAAALLAASPAEVIVGVTGAEPADGQLGVRDGMLVDAAFGAGDLLPVAEVRPAGAHNITNALAAAALTLAIGVTGDEVATGLREFVPGGHRNTVIGEVAGVRFIDDSKATNPHAASASLADYPSVVWIAGGQLKGADIDDLVAQHAARLRGVVVLGVDRHLVAAALQRHAPEVPRLVVDRTDDGVMTSVVQAAAAMARPGDVVLLAPAAASLDMFASYAARGDAFEAAVERLYSSAVVPPTVGHGAENPSAEGE